MGFQNAILAPLPYPLSHSKPAFSSQTLLLQSRPAFQAQIPSSTRLRLRHLATFCGRQKATRAVEVRPAWILHLRVWTYENNLVFNCPFLLSRVPSNSHPKQARKLSCARSGASEQWRNFPKRINSLSQAIELRRALYRNKGRCLVPLNDNAGRGVCPSVLLQLL